MGKTTGGSAVVIGGTKGLGLGIAEALLERAYETTVLGRTDPERSADRLRLLRADLLKEHDVRAAGAAISKLEDLRVVVWTAVKFVKGPLWKMSVRDIDEMYHIGLSAPVQLLSFALETMVRRGTEGHLAIVSSTTGLDPKAEEEVYGSIKAAQINFARSLALTLPDHIRVLLVTPGGMDTPHFWKDHPRLDRKEFMDPAKVGARIVEVMRAQTEKLEHLHLPRQENKDLI